MLSVCKPPPTVSVISPVECDPGLYTLVGPGSTLKKSTNHNPPDVISVCRPPYHQSIFESFPPFVMQPDPKEVSYLYIFFSAFLPTQNVIL